MLKIDKETAKIAIYGFIATVICLGVLEYTMAWIYDALDHAGVFHAIVKMFG